MITANYEPRINRARLYAETFAACRKFSSIKRRDTKNSARFALALWESGRAQTGAYFYGSSSSSACR